jgi:hypothetical protein
MDFVFRATDCAALEAYRRAYVRGAEHEAALNIVVSNLVLPMSANRYAPGEEARVAAAASAACRGLNH